MLVNKCIIIRNDRAGPVLDFASDNASPNIILLTVVNDNLDFVGVDIYDVTHSVCCGFGPFDFDQTESMF